MDFKEFKEKKEVVVKSIKNIKEDINDKEIIRFLEEKILKLENEKFIISVFGHFSNGKSSFLNALMGFGEEVLVEDELASTATITRILFPPEDKLKDKAKIVFKSGDEKVVEVQEIKNYSARNRGVNVEEEIAEVILYLESELLSHGVEIVDTPGFNSTHSIHTDIAKGYVNNSDASIFLFSYDKPGSREEFSFLKDVNDKMDRIFLVLNKIDKEDRTESTIEDTVEDLKNKIYLAGGNVKSKFVHPISAKLEKEGICEGNKEKRDLGRVTEFKSKLANYLTSAENVSDRIDAPIKSIVGRLNECREVKKDLLEKYSLENNEINEEVKKIKKDIDELEKDLKDRQKALKRSISHEVSQATENIETVVADLEKEIGEELKDVKSKFSLRYTDFDDITNGATERVQNVINISQRRLVGRLTNLIDMQVDNDEELLEVKNKLVAAIEMKLNISQRDDLSVDEIDIEIFDDLDKEIKDKQRELNESKNMWHRLTRETCENEDIRFEILQQEQQLKRLNDEKRDRILSIGDGQAYRAKKSKTDYVSRRGLIGAITECFIGEKRVDSEYDEYDTSEIELKEKQKVKVEMEYKGQVDKLEEQLARDKNRVRGSKVIEIEQREAERNYRTLSESFIKAQEECENQKFDHEQRLVSVNVRKYKNALKNYMSEISGLSIENLNSNEGILYKIVEVSLDGVKRNIAMKNKTMEEILYTQSISPEELDMKIKEVSEDIVKINNGIKDILELKGE